MTPPLERARARAARVRLRLSRPTNLARHAAHDAWRLWRHGGLHPTEHSVETKLAMLTLGYHVLEKGLALAPSKPWFGQAEVLRTLDRAERWGEALAAAPAYRHAIDALAGYVAANERNQPPVWAEGVPARVAALAEAIGGVSGPPVLHTSYVEITGSLPADPEAFWATRHSIRQFAAEPVPWSCLQRAVSIAQVSPRVCNRESIRVRAFPQGPQADAVLALQTGNRGFGDQAPWILVISVDTSSFTTVGERNQCWVDGGIFTMSLVMALHAIGLGSCCLNWSQTLGPDRQLRELVGIMPSEVVITLMAVGRPVDQLPVARSASAPVDAVLLRGQVRRS